MSNQQAHQREVHHAHNLCQEEVLFQVVLEVVERAVPCFQKFSQALPHQFSVFLCIEGFSEVVKKPPFMHLHFMLSLCLSAYIRQEEYCKEDVVSSGRKLRGLSKIL